MTDSADVSPAFAGTWNVTIATPLGKIVTVFEIEETDGIISGVARSSSESVAFDNPIIDGDRLRWSQRVTKPMRLNLNFDVAVTDDALEGTSKAGRLPSSRVAGTRSV
jgi:hypothetical protein